MKRKFDAGENETKKTLRRDGLVAGDPRAESSSMGATRNDQQRKQACVEQDGRVGIGEQHDRLDVGQSCEHASVNGQWGFPDGHQEHEHPIADGQKGCPDPVKDEHVHIDAPRHSFERIEEPHRCVQNFDQRARGTRGREPHRRRHRRRHNRKLRRRESHSRSSCESSDAPSRLHHRMQVREYNELIQARLREADERGLEGLLQARLERDNDLKAEFDRLHEARVQEYAELDRLHKAKLRHYEDVRDTSAALIEAELAELEQRREERLREDAVLQQRHAATIESVERTNCYQLVLHDRLQGRMEHLEMVINAVGERIQQAGERIGAFTSSPDQAEDVDEDAMDVDVED